MKAYRVMGCVTVLLIFSAATTDASLFECEDYFAALRINNPSCVDFDEISAMDFSTTSIQFPLEGTISEADAYEFEDHYYQRSSFFNAGADGLNRIDFIATDADQRSYSVPEPSTMFLLFTGLLGLARHWTKAGKQQVN